MSAAIPIFDVEYEHPLPGSTCDTKHAWARVPVEPSPAERAELRANQLAIESMNVDELDLWMTEMTLAAQAESEP